MMVGGMLRVGKGRPEWGAVPGVKYFVIEIDYIEVLCTDDWERAGCPKPPNNRKEQYGIPAGKTWDHDARESTGWYVSAVRG